MIQLTNQAFTLSKNNKIKNFFLSAALKVEYGYERIYRRNTDIAVFIFAVEFVFFEIIADITGTDNQI